MKPLLIIKSRAKAILNILKVQQFFIILDIIFKYTNLNLDFKPKVKIIFNIIYKYKN